MLKLFVIVVIFSISCCQVSGQFPFGKQNRRDIWNVFGGLIGGLTGDPTMRQRADDDYYGTYSPARAEAANERALGNFAGSVLRVVAHSTMGDKLVEGRPPRRNPDGSIIPGTGQGVQNNFLYGRRPIQGHRPYYRPPPPRQPDYYYYDDFQVVNRGAGMRQRPNYQYHQYQYVDDNRAPSRSYIGFHVKPPMPPVQRPVMPPVPLASFQTTQAIQIQYPDESSSGMSETPIV